MKIGFICLTLIIWILPLFCPNICHIDVNTEWLVHDFMWFYAGPLQLLFEPAIELYPFIDFSRNKQS